MGKDSEAPKYKATTVKLGRGKRTSARSAGSLTHRQAKAAPSTAPERQVVKEVPNVAEQVAPRAATLVAPPVSEQVSIPTPATAGNGAYPGTDSAKHASAEQLNVGTQSLLDAALLQGNRSFAETTTAAEQEQLTPDTIEKNGVFSRKAPVNDGSFDDGLEDEAEKVFTKSGSNLPPQALANKTKRKGQQRTLLIMGCLLCAMSAYQFFAASGEDSQGIHASSLLGSSVRHSKADLRNPEIGWVEYYLCRGRATSPFCSSEVKHPFVEKWEEVGHKMNREDRAHTVKSLRQTFYTPERGPRRH